MTAHWHHGDMGTCYRNHCSTCTRIWLIIFLPCTNFNEIVNNTVNHGSKTSSNTPIFLFSTMVVLSQRIIWSTLEKNRRSRFCGITIWNNPFQMGRKEGFFVQKRYILVKKREFSFAMHAKHFLDPSALRRHHITNICWKLLLLNGLNRSYCPLCIASRTTS
jgi:hypothetical protein